MRTICIGLLFCLLTGPAVFGQSGPGTNDLKIITRQEWQAKEPVAKMKPHELKFITIHHTATRQKPGVSVAVKLQHLQAFSQREDTLAGGKKKPIWPDVPYHFYVTCDGEIGEGRDIRYVGDTNTEYDPTGHILVTLEGNFEIEEPTKEQMVAAKKLIAWLAAKYQIPPERIKAHKDYAQTACPGKKLYERLGEFRKEK